VSNLRYILSRRLPGGSERNHEKPQHSLCLGRDSNRELPKYRSQAPFIIDCIFTFAISYTVSPLVDHNTLFVTAAKGDVRFVIRLFKW
jgi:hypothetical protein